MKRLTWAILILSPGLASPVFAHELATHGALTYQAYDHSILKADLSNPQDPQFVEKVLGLDIQGNPRNPFGSDYYDISGERTERRSANDFENAIIVRELENLGVNQLSLPGWLLRGAIREDDWTGVDFPGCTVLAENPQDDPYSDPPDRPLNHFFDPFHDIPLTVFGVARGQCAPDWAMGVADAFNGPNAPDPARRNHYTVLDAREAMYRALTGRKQYAALSAVAVRQPSPNTRLSVTPRTARRFSSSI